MLCAAFDEALTSGAAAAYSDAASSPVKGVARPLAAALLRCHRRDLVVTGCLRLANTLLQLGAPLFLNRLLVLVEARAAADGGAAAVRVAGAAAALVTSQHWSALRLGGLLAASLATRAFVESQYFYRGSLLGSAVKATLRAATFAKVPAPWTATIRATVPASLLFAASLCRLLRGGAGPMRKAPFAPFAPFILLPFCPFYPFYPFCPIFPPFAPPLFSPPSGSETWQR